MKILCVVESGTWVEPHIIGSLRQAGHAVDAFFYGSQVGEFYERNRREERAGKNRRLLARARELQQGAGLDLIFCYVYDDFLLQETALALFRLDVPMVNYNVDMSNQWYRQTRTARYFSRMLCAQRDNMRLLAHYNPRVLHFPMAARLSPTGNDAASEFPIPAPVTFVGTPMPYRLAVLARLHRAGVPLAVYGKNWQEGSHATPGSGAEKALADVWHYLLPKLRAEGLSGLFHAIARRVAAPSEAFTSELPSAILHGFVPERDVQRLLAGSRINLGFTRMAGADPDVMGRNQVKLRDFEVPMAGGFYLVERAKEYAEYFTFGVEVETWSTPEELTDKIRYYLDHEKERRLIAAAGKKRALADHTWARRFEMLFDDLGLTGKLE